MKNQIKQAVHQNWSGAALAATVSPERANRDFREFRVLSDTFFFYEQIKMFPVLHALVGKRT